MFQYTFEKSTADWLSDRNTTQFTVFLIENLSVYQCHRIKCVHLSKVPRSFFYYLFNLCIRVHTDGTRERWICEVKILRVFSIDLYIFSALIDSVYTDRFFYDWNGFRSAARVPHYFAHYHSIEAFSILRANTFSLPSILRSFLFVRSFLFLIFTKLQHGKHLGADRDQCNSCYCICVRCHHVSSLLSPTTTMEATATIQTYQSKYWSIWSFVCSFVILFILSSHFDWLVEPAKRTLIAHGTRNMCHTQSSCTCGCDARG